MENFKLSHMNHFKTIPYKKIPNFREFYYEDKTNIVYYLDWDRVLRYYKATGYDGIEVAPWDIADEMALFGTPENFRDFAAEHGLAVTSSLAGSSGNLVDRSKHKETIDAFMRNVTLMKRFGCDQIGFGSGSYYGNAPLSDDEVKAMIEGLNIVGPRALDQGVRICMHPTFHAAVNYDNIRRILDETDPESVFIQLDTAQISIMGFDVVKFYDDYHERVYGFHLKDTADPYVEDKYRFARDAEIQDDGHRWFWEPGEGVMDFPALWELLKKYQFKGWMTIETDGTPDLLASMALSSYYVNQVLGKIYR